MTALPITPGPWVAERNFGCKRITAKSSYAGQKHRQARRVEVACTPGLNDESEDFANAKAMAAVPAMIEALLALKPLFMETQSFGFGEYRERYADAISKLNAALKAAGITEEPTP